jgi:hypothetical protein
MAGVFVWVAMSGNWDSRADLFPVVFFWLVRRSRQWVDRPALKNLGPMTSFVNRRLMWWTVPAPDNELR